LKPHFYYAVVHGQYVRIERVPPGRADGAEDWKVPTPETEKPGRVDPDPDLSRHRGHLSYDDKGLKKQDDELKHTRGSNASGWGKPHRGE